MVKVHRVRLIKDLQDLPPTLRTDQEKLKQILINLLSNATKFTEVGSITLHVRAVGERVELAVTDTGIGIPKAALGLIFEEFRQVDGGATRVHGGTGLGLAISHRLARMLGGEIAAESEEGAGLQHSPLTSRNGSRDRPSLSRNCGRRLTLPRFRPGPG